MLAFITNKVIFFRNEYRTESRVKDAIKEILLLNNIAMKYSKTYYSLANLIAKGLIKNTDGDHFTEVREALESESNNYDPKVNDSVLFIDPTFAYTGEYTVINIKTVSLYDVRIKSKHKMNNSRGKKEYIIEQVYSHELFPL